MEHEGEVFFMVTICCDLRRHLIPFKAQKHLSPGLTRGSQMKGAGGSLFAKL